MTGCRTCKHMQQIMKKGTDRYMVRCCNWFTGVFGPFTEDELNVSCEEYEEV